MTLPPFPVDDQALSLIEAAIAGTDGEEGRSSVADLCSLYSELGGSDPHAVESVEGNISVLRDPQYHPNDIITALAAEVRRLRGREAATTP
jgi:hypothetical protein